jgi:hypothetical protein
LKGATGPQGATGSASALASTGDVSTQANLVFYSNILYYASNVTFQGSTITASNITVTNVTQIPFPIIVGCNSMINLTSAYYASTFVFSNAFGPTFQNLISSYPFFVYLKNIGPTLQQISVYSGGTTYYIGGPAGCNLYSAATNVTGNSPLTILYAGSSTVSTWKLY